MIQIHDLIAGFTQGIGRWNGLLKLYEKILSAEGCCFNFRLWFHRWKDDWESVAERIWLIGDRFQDKIEVYIYGYSYGGGWGAIRLAKYLNKANIKVRVMVLSDPVFRHPNILLRWTSLVSWSKIKCPTNVKTVHMFYQRINKPSGHKIIVNDKTTILATCQKLNYTHNKMDDAPEFHLLALNVAKEAKNSLNL